MRQKESGASVFGVDSSPRAVQDWDALGLNADYGDMTDPEFFAELPLSSAKWLVSPVPVQVQGVSLEDTRQTLIRHPGWLALGDG